MFSLFAVIPTNASQELHPLHHSVNGSLHNSEDPNASSTGLQIYPEDDRHLIAVSAVTVIARLAQDLHNAEVRLIPRRTLYLY